MTSFVDVALIKIEVVLKVSFKVVIESLNNEFIINEFSFKERLEVILIKEKSS